MYVENDSDGNDVFKHIATLIDVETDTVDDSIDVIGEYPIMENGHVLTTPLEDCIEICREGEQITMSDFTDILSNISHAKEGSSPIMGLARILKDYKIEVVLPGEEEAEDDGWDIDVELMFDDSDGVYHVENDSFDFQFEKNAHNIGDLKKYLKNRRDEYYQAFDDKDFRIVFNTRNEDFEDLVDEINSSSPE
jgi:hypothetical protein